MGIFYYGLESYFKDKNIDVNKFYNDFENESNISNKYFDNDYLPIICKILNSLNENCSKEYQHIVTYIDGHIRIHCNDPDIK